MRAMIPCVIILISCQTHRDIVELPDPPILDQSLRDLESRDLSVRKEPDMSMFHCDDMHPCPDNGICGPGGVCGDCGGDGRGCCGTTYKTLWCQPGLNCFQCDAFSFGYPATICQDVNCGASGGSCCWHWAHGCKEYPWQDKCRPGLFCDLKSYPKCH